MSAQTSLFGEPVSEVQTSASRLLDGKMSVEEWVDFEPPTELWMKPRADRIRIVFCPDRESYAAACKMVLVAAFTPAEVQRLADFAAIVTTKGPDVVAEAQRVVDKIVVAKAALPGTKLHGLLAFFGGAE